MTLITVSSGLFTCHGKGMGNRTYFQVKNKIKFCLTYIFTTSIKLNFVKMQKPIVFSPFGAFFSLIFQRIEKRKISLNIELMRETFIFISQVHIYVKTMLNDC